MEFDREFIHRHMAEEWNRYDRLQTAISFQTALIAAFVSAFVFFGMNLPSPRMGVLFWLFITLFLLTIIVFGAQVVYLIRSWYGYEYALTPSLDYLRNKRAEIRAHYDGLELSAKIAESETARVFGDRLLDVELDVARRNRVTNNRRSDFLHFAKGLFLLSFSLLVLTFLLFVGIRAVSDQRPAIRIDDELKVRLMSQQPESPAPDEDGQPTSPPPEPDIVFEPEFIKEADLTRPRPADPPAREVRDDQS